MKEMTEDEMNRSQRKLPKDIGLGHGHLAKMIDGIEGHTLDLVHHIDGVK